MSNYSSSSKEKEACFTCFNCDTYHLHTFTILAILHRADSPLLDCIASLHCSLFFFVFFCHAYFVKQAKGIFQGAMNRQKQHTLASMPHMLLRNNKKMQVDASHRFTQQEEASSCPEGASRCLAQQEGASSVQYLLPYYSKAQRCKYYISDSRQSTKRNMQVSQYVSELASLSNCLCYIYQHKQSAIL